MMFWLLVGSPPQSDRSDYDGDHFVVPQRCSDENPAHDAGFSLTATQ